MRFTVSTSLLLLVGILNGCSGGAASSAAPESELDRTGAPAAAIDHESEGVESAAGGSATTSDPTWTRQDEPKPSRDGAEPRTPSKAGESANEAGKDDAAANGRGAGGAAAIGDSSPTDEEDEDTTVYGPLSNTDWMAQIPGLKKRPINAIRIPGTHDSGTYGVISVYNRPVDDPFAPDDEESWVRRLGEFGGVTDKWAKAQDRTILEQLNDGVRALDLRACAEKNGTLRVCHTLYSVLVSDILTDVATFAAQHPKELVLIDISRFMGMGDNEHARLIAEVYSKLGPYLLDAHLGQVHPTMTLGDIWKTGKSVAVIYHDSRAARQFMTGDDLDGSYDGEIWKRPAMRTRLEEFMAADHAKKLTWWGLQPTPGTDLIEYSFDPLGNYPKSLEAIASATNPVILGWVKNDWANKPINIMAVDYYENSCVVQLAQWLNGGQVSFEGCHIGEETTYGSWAFTPYARGAGQPMTCAAGEEQMAGLCYPSCNPGYQSNIGFPYLCQTPCGSGERDDGLTCFRDLSVVSANTSSCKPAALCVVSGCAKCPDGYHNDGCTCSRAPAAFEKSRYNRGVGHPVSSCPAGTEQDGALCYPTCRTGYVGRGPVCYPQAT